MFRHFWLVEFTYRYIFLHVRLRCKLSDITFIIDHTPVANLPPVSSIPVTNLPSCSVVDIVVKFAAGTCRKVSTGVHDYGGKFAAGA